MGRHHALGSNPDLLGNLHSYPFRDDNREFLGCYDNTDSEYGLNN